jgi:hypothetical protein
MYVYSRRRQLNPASVSKALPLAIEAGQRATAITGVDISVWMTVMSADAGTVSWAALVEHLSDIGAASDKLGADDVFNDFIEEHDGLFVGPVSDTVGQIISGTPDPSAPPEYITVVRATCANGHVAAGMAGGVEIAEAASRIGGLPTLFLADGTGEYGGVSWITAAPDLTALEESTAKVNTDPGFLELVDGITSAYLPHAPMSILRRIG